MFDLNVSTSHLSPTEGKNHRTRSGIKFIHMYERPFVPYPSKALLVHQGAPPPCHHAPFSNLLHCYAATLPPCCPITLPPAQPNHIKQLCHTTLLYNHAIQPRHTTTSYNQAIKPCHTIMPPCLLNACPRLPGGRCINP